MPKKIVIGYDGSIDAQAAAAWALDESARTGAFVEFVHAREPSVRLTAGELEKAVGVDDSVPARSALAFAADEAARRGVALRAIRAGWPTISARHLELFHAWMAQARREHPGLEISAEAVGGSPARVLVRASADAQLVVVGSRGRGAARGALLGSVSHYLLRHCAGNLAVVHGTSS